MAKRAQTFSTTTLQNHQPGQKIVPKILKSVVYSIGKEPCYPEQPARLASICLNLKGKAGLLDEVDASVWHKDWVVHSQSVGKGEGALKYLAPYIFHVAISNKRILQVADGRVTFAYSASDTEQWRHMTLSVDHFLQRFLQHVLPKGFVKVPYYGLFSPSKRHLLPIIQLMFGKDQPITRTIEKPTRSTSVNCPTCG